MDEQIPSRAGIVTKRTRLSNWERHNRYSKNARTYDDLADMAFKIHKNSWKMDTTFYYEDPSDPTKHVLCSVVDSCSNELGVTKFGERFESLTLSAFPFEELLEFLLDVVGTLEFELSLSSYTGNHKNLGGKYAKYIQYLV